MDKRILLLRAVNVGGRRVPMAELRELLSGAGYMDVQSYLQSGNAVIGSEEPPAEIGETCRRLISERFGFDVPVLVRTAAEFEGILAVEPLGDIVSEPRRYWIAFLDGELAPDRLARLRGLAAGQERVELIGRELHAWLPDGAGRSKLGAAMANPARDVIATARNLATAHALLEMARG